MVAEANAAATSGAGQMPAGGDKRPADVGAPIAVSPAELIPAPAAAAGAPSVELAAAGAADASAAASPRSQADSGISLAETTSEIQPAAANDRKLRRRCQETSSAMLELFSPPEPRANIHPANGNESRTNGAANSASNSPNDVNRLITYSPNGGAPTAGQPVSNEQNGQSVPAAIVRANKPSPVALDFTSPPEPLLAPRRVETQRSSSSDANFEAIPDHDKVPARQQPWPPNAPLATSLHYACVPDPLEPKSLSLESERRAEAAEAETKRLRAEQRRQSAIERASAAAEIEAATGAPLRAPLEPSTSCHHAAATLRSDSLSGRRSDARQHSAASAPTERSSYIAGGGGGTGFGGGGASMESTIRPKATGTVAAEPWKDQSGGGRLFIKGGQVVNDDSMFLADILVEDGQIRQVGPNMQTPAGCKVIDAAGKMVLPGGIDTQTHLQSNFHGAATADDFLSGSKAALAGGTTMIVDVAMPCSGESMVSAFDKWRALADEKVCCDYALTVLVPGWNDRVRTDMAQLVKQKGVNSFLFLMAYKDRGVMLRDDQLYQGFVQCRQIGALARVHAENGDVIAELERHMMSLGITGPEGHLQARPEELESEATQRVCSLARAANCAVAVVRVAGGGAARAVAKQRKAGAVVFGEATAAALGTDGTHHFNRCWSHAAAHVTAPPLRADPDAPLTLAHMLASGELHAVMSDHRAHKSAARAAGASDFTKIPHGVNGIEERMAIVWERGVHRGNMDPMRFVAVTSANAAKIFNLYPKKGRIAVGADADLVVWDPAAKRTISAKSHEQAGDFNIFEGMSVHGVVAATVARGRLVYEGGQLNVKAGTGRFVPLPAHSPHVFAVVSQREKVCQPQKIDRDPYRPGAPPPTKQVDAAKTAGETPIKPKSMRQEHVPVPAADFRSQQSHHGRPLTQAGGRNMQDSSFSISGAQFDDEKETRMSSTKISQPPGGKSGPLW